jgi:hypothetical protein
MSDFHRYFSEPEARKAARGLHPSRFSVFSIVLMIQVLKISNSLLLAE